MFSLLSDIALSSKMNLKEKEVYLDKCKLYMEEYDTILQVINGKGKTALIKNNYVSMKNVINMKQKSSIVNLNSYGIYINC